MEKIFNYCPREQYFIIFILRLPKEETSAFQTALVSHLRGILGRSCSGIRTWTVWGRFSSQKVSRWAQGLLPATGKGPGNDNEGSAQGRLSKAQMTLYLRYRRRIIPLPGKPSSPRRPPSTWTSVGDEDVPLPPSLRPANQSNRGNRPRPPTTNL